MLPVSRDCPILIASSVFSNFYCYHVVHENKLPCICSEHICVLGVSLFSTYMCVRGINIASLYFFYWILELFRQCDNFCFSLYSREILWKTFFKGL
jgi:hypothetical protein